ncbi:MAG: amidohydrolase family protein [Defluviitaleaceae bacterium]|nr:amidohydrolase family protein [Defluviitaleaceae bacterium]
MDILFKNTTAVTMNPEAPILHNIDIGIQGRKITYIEATTTPPPAAKRMIDGTNKVLMPGLYNCHTHAAMTLFRGYANDRTLEDWLFNYIFPAEQKLTPKLTHTGTMLAIAEMISSGTISFTDMYFFMDEVAGAAHEAGVLANVSNAIIGFDKDSYDFYKDNVYSQTANALDKYHNKNDGRIKVEASIHGVYTSYAPAWKQVTDFAAKHSLGLHVHLSETSTEHNNCISTYNMTPAQVFHKHGVFDLPCIAAHGVWVTDEDIKILAESGVCIAHNPLSNLKLASGLAPVDKMLKGGVNVTLGTDGVASNNSHDLFEEIKMASLLQKYAESDPTAAPAMSVLEMATINGAKSQGRAHESGMLKKGYDADMLMIDFNNPRQMPCYDAALNLAYSTSGRDVEMTICRGQVLYEKGEYKTIDIEKLLYDVKDAMKVFI